MSHDVVTLSFGFMLLLIWAGFVEAFLSQYHEPFVPYSAKIAFGAIELIACCIPVEIRAMNSSALVIKTPEGIVFFANSGRAGHAFLACSRSTQYRRSCFSAHSVIESVWPFRNRGERL